MHCWTVGRVNPSSSAFYQSKGRVDGSLDEPTVSATANAIKNQRDGPMTKFYVDNWITALRGSVVRRVFGTHERIVVFGSEHGEYSNTINFRFIEYVSESSRP